MGISLHPGTGYADHTFIIIILSRPFAMVLPFLCLTTRARRVLSAFWAPGESSEGHRQNSSDTCYGEKSREESWAVGLGAQWFSGGRQSGPPCRTRHYWSKGWWRWGVSSLDEEEESVSGKGHGKGARGAWRGAAGLHRAWKQMHSERSAGATSLRALEGFYCYSKWDVALHLWKKLNRRVTSDLGFKTSLWLLAELFLKWIPSHITSLLKTLLQITISYKIIPKSSFLVWPARPSWLGLLHPFQQHCLPISSSLYFQSCFGEPLAVLSSL